MTKSIDDNLLAPGIKSKQKLRDSFKNILPKEILNKKKFAFQAPEARSFFNYDNSTSHIAQEYMDNFNLTRYQNKDSLTGLFKKIKDPYSSKRLGFRENMAFMIGISEFCLQKFKEEYKSIR